MWIYLILDWYFFKFLILYCNLNEWLINNIDKKKNEWLINNIDRKKIFLNLIGRIFSL